MVGLDRGTIDGKDVVTVLNNFGGRLTNLATSVVHSSVSNVITFVLTFYMLFYFLKGSPPSAAASEKTFPLYRFGNRLSVP